jgi:hypothetical protein
VYVCKAQLVEALTLGQSGERGGEAAEESARARLLGMGFAPERVDEALLLADNEESAALDILMA